MLVPRATAGGFGGREIYTDGQPPWVLAPDAVPKLVVMALLLALLGLWCWGYLRSLER